MIPKLIFLALLFVCAYPQALCSYRSAPFTFIVNTEVPPSDITCDRVMTSFDIDPKLPLGLNLDAATGSITGTPLIPSVLRTYKVTGVDRDGTTTVVSITIQVLVPLTKCDYQVAKAVFLTNYPNFIMPPVCDSKGSLFTLASGTLPVGISLNTTTGGIGGVTNAVVSDGTITVSIVGYGGTSVTASLPYTVILPTSDKVKAGVLSRYFANGPAWTVEDPYHQWFRFDTYDVKYVTKKEESMKFLCEKSACDTVGGNTYDMYGKLTATIHLETPGEYAISYLCDDTATFFFDDMNVPKGFTTVWNDEKTFTFNNVADSWHAIGILVRNTGIDRTSLDVKWKIPGTIDFVDVPGSVFKHIPSPVQQMKYNYLEASAYVGEQLKLTAEIYGYCQSPSSSPSLSTIGLELSLLSGDIVGSPTVSSPQFVTYTIKCQNSITDYGESKTTIMVRVLEKAYANAFPGLLGYYYKAPGTSCNYYEPGGLTLRYIRVADQGVINHASGKKTWDGLSADFATDYYVRFTGFLNLQQKEIVTVGMNIEDSGRAWFTNAGGAWMTLDGNCEYRSNTLKYEQTVAGFNFLQVDYIKGSTSLTKQLEVFYFTPTIERQIIPTSVMCHFPLSSFEYRFMQADYVSGVEITRNCPLFLKGDEKLYTTFSSDPALPQGLNLDAQGCITGRTNGNYTLVTITMKACKTGTAECITCPVSLESHAYTIPSNLHYPSDLTGLIGMTASLKPTFSSATVVSWSSEPSLPAGLFFGDDGTILGFPVSAFDQTVTVTCSNPAGSTTTSLLIRIRDCSSGETFVYLQYILGDPDLTMTLLSTGSNPTVLYAKSLSTGHVANGYYSAYFCSSQSNLKLQMDFSGERGGTYIVGGLNNVIFRKGGWGERPGNIAFEFSCIASNTPELTYPQSSYTFSSGQTVQIYSNPIVGGVISFELDDSVANNVFPAGISLNTTAGNIYGFAIVGAEGTKIVTIKAWGSGKINSVTVTITFIITSTCPTGSILFTVYGLFVGNARSSNYKLTGPSGIVSEYKQGFREFEEFRWSECLPIGAYIFYYQAPGNVRFSLYKSNIMMRDYLWGAGGMASYNVPLFLLIDPTTSWEYSYTHETNWQDGSGWSKTTSISKLPLADAQTTTYFRTSFQTSGVNFATLSRLDLTISYKDGVVVYINGKELYRRNLAKDADPNSFSTRSFPTLTSRIVYGSPDQLKDGRNTIAVEIHKGTAASDNQFKLELSFSFDTDNQCQNVFPIQATMPDSDKQLYSLQTNYDFNAAQGFAKTLDNRLDTKTYCDGPVTIRYRLRNSAASVLSRYIIGTAGDCVSRDPGSWVIEGTREFIDDSSSLWETINDRPTGGLPGISMNGEIQNTDQAFSRNKLSTFTIPTIPTYAFEAFRFIIKTVKGPYGGCGGALQFSEFNLKICKQISCSQDGLWPPTLPGRDVELDCPVGSLGTQTRRCNETGGWDDPITVGCIKENPATNLFYNPSTVEAFTGNIFTMTPSVNGLVTSFGVVPDLPKGVTINVKTGVLTGSTNELVPNAAYTVTASLPNGKSITAQITLTITAPFCAKGIVSGIDVPDTPVGNNVKGKCRNGFSGSTTISCALTIVGPSWTQPDTSKCINAPSPQCGTISDIIVKVGATVDKTVNCLHPPNSFTLIPFFPNGLSISIVGTTIQIKGIPSMPLSPTTYLVNATYSESFKTGFDELYFVVKIFAPLARCSYDFVGTFQVFQGVYIEIFPPTCDALVENYVLGSTPLPQGLKLNTVSGSIIGIPTIKLSTGVSIIMTANNTANSVQFQLQLIVSDPDFEATGLEGEVTNENLYATRPNIADVKSKWDLGEIPITKVPMINNFGHWKGNPITFPNGIVRATHFMIKYKGAIKFPTSGNFIFTQYFDNVAWLYIDDMNTPVLSQIWEDRTKSVTKHFTSGWHPMEFYYYSESVGTEWLLQWNYETQAITVIPDSVFGKVSKGVVQKVTYPSQNLLLVKGMAMETLTPTVIGYISEWDINPDLPPGITFNNGIFSGTPSRAFNKQLYTITAKNSVIITVKLTIGVLDNTASSLSTGLTGYYYSGNIGCNIIEPTSNELTLKFKRFETGGLQFPSSDSVWSGLSNEFKNSFIVYWLGYLTFPEAGRYRFKYSSQDWSRLYIANGYYSNPGCGVIQMEFEDQFPKGLTSFGVLFGKSSDSKNKSFEISWSHEVGNFAFSMRKIEASELFHQPEGYLEYTYKLANYVSQVPIPENKPLFFQVNQGLYTIFSSFPGLPAGLTLNPSTGVIFGTPTDNSVMKTIYTITAKSSTDTLTCQIELTVNQRLIPVDLSYPAVTADIGKTLRVNGQPVTSVSPTIVNGMGVNYAPKDKFPSGLKLDPSTGVISGIPTEKWDKPIIIIATNPSGSCETSWILTVNGCSSNQVFSRMEYAVGNGATVVTIFLGSINLHRDNKAALFSTNNVYQACDSPDSFNVTYTKNINASPGWFKYYINNLLVQSGNASEATTVDSWLVNGILSNSPPILLYPAETHVIPGQVINICPSIQNGADLIKLISPSTLPTGLRFDTSTGCVTGTTMNVQFSPSFEIQVSASNPSGESQPVTFNVIGDNVCPENSQMATFSYQCNSGCSSTYYRFKSISSANSLITNTGNFLNHEKWHSSCLSPGAYIVTVGSSSNAQWSDYTKFIIYLGGSMIGSYRLTTNVNEQDTTISLTSYVQDNSLWGYSSEAPLNDKWKSEYDYSLFAEQYRSGLFPARFSISTYYGIEFGFYDSFDVIKGLEMGVTFDAAITIYVNGNKLYEVGYPTGFITSKTYAYSIRDAVSRQISIPPVLLVNGKNYIAIECHKHRSSLAVDPFRVSILPVVIVPGSARCSRVSYSDVEGMYGWVTDNAKTWDAHEGVRLVTDKNTGTKLLVQFNPTKLPVSLYLYWPNNRAEFFNQYTIYTANDVFQERNPQKWKVYGSGTFDDLNWDLLSSIDYGNLPQQQFKPTSFDLTNNYKSYNAFRIDIYETTKTSIGDYQLSEFTADYCRPVYCPQQDVWPATPSLYTVKIKCNETGTSGWKTRVCTFVSDTVSNWANIDSSKCLPHATILSYPKPSFYKGFQNSVIPTLNGGVVSFTIDCQNGMPTGLEFNTENGELHGIITAYSSSTVYSCTVTAQTNGEVSPTAGITITIQESICNPLDGYESAPSGEIRYKECGVEYTGQSSRTCSTTKASQWEEEDRSNCKLLVPEFIYHDVELNRDNIEFMCLLTSVCTYTPVKAENIAISSYVASGELPPALKLDATTGTITYTTPVTVAAIIEITITASNKDTSFTRMLKFHSMASSIIVYSSNIFTVYKNLEVDINKITSKPGVLGYVGAITVTPPLPEGLYLSPISGLVIGKVNTIPTVPTNRHTPTGTVGTIASDFTLTIATAMCSGETEAGVTKTTPCSSPQIGNITQHCPLMYDPVYEATINTCANPNPTSINYPTITGSLNLQLTPVKPIVYGDATTLVFSLVSGSQLPDGILLDSDGTIYGSPTVVGSSNVQIQAFGNVMKQTSVNIVITTAKCLADSIRGLPESDAGTLIKVACPSGYSGNGAVRCSFSSNPVWGETDYSACYTPAPTGWGYGSNPVIFSVGFFKTLPPVPSSGGGIPTSTRIITGSLPDGIRLTEKGELSGSPTNTFSPSPLVILGTNSLGTAETSFNIQVIRAVCAAEGEWPETAAGGIAVRPCINSELVGDRSRLCNSTENPKWLPLVDTCKEGPPSIDYVREVTIYFSVAVDIRPTKVQGNPTSFSIEPPDLLPGLSFDSVTGAISGKVSSSVGTTSLIYRIFASNSQGTSSGILLILTVKGFTCKTEGVWSEAEYGSSSAILCPSGYIGIQIRPCNSFQVSGGFPQGKWGNLDNSSCVEEKDKSNPIIPNNVNLRFEMTIPFKTPDQMSGTEYLLLQTILAQSINEIALNGSKYKVDPKNILLEFLNGTNPDIDSILVVVRISDTLDNCKGIADAMNPNKELVANKMNEIISNQYTDYFGTNTITIDTGGEIEGPTGKGPDSINAGTNIGLIVGVSVAGVAVLIIIVGCIYCRCLTRTTQKRKKPAAKKKSAAAAGAPSGSAPNEKGTDAKKDEKQGVRV